MGEVIFLRAPIGLTSLSAMKKPLLIAALIGATALFKLAHQLQLWGMSLEDIARVNQLALLELVIATLVVGYVSLRYLHHYRPTTCSPTLLHHSQQ